MAGGKQRGEKKTKDEDGSLKEESSLKDRLLASGGESLTPSVEIMKKKKRSEKHEASAEDVGVSSSLSEGNVDVNNASDKNERKKKKSERNGDCSEVVAVSSSLSEGNVDVNNAEEKNEKKKKKSKRHEDVAVSLSEGDIDVNYARGRNEKKERKRKLEHGNNEKASQVARKKNKVSEAGEVLEETHMLFKKKEKKKRKKKHNVVQEAASIQIMAETMGNQSSVIESDGGNSSSIKNKARDGKLKVNDEGGNKRKKKAKSLGNGSKEKSSKRVTQMEKDVETTGPSEKSSSKATSKRVSFCEDVEVFPSSDGPSDEKAVGEGGLVRGKRFSHEEDEMVKEAVLNYIDVHGLGAEGLNMVLNCKKHPAIVQCWKEIGAALPWRPRQSVYHRAHILFERGQNSSWTPEEYELIRKFHEKHGSDWKTLAEALGKHRFHVKDTWRRIKLINMKKGKWSQDEYQSLFDFVNLDLRLKAFEERKTKHGMLRDNISWTAISERLETRTDALCCQKWYDQLTSPLVAEGKWLDTDDYRLLMELYDLDACCMEDVDWDNLLEHRSGDLCRKRWNQMVKHLGDHRNKSFADQVDVLIKRYCPDVLEAREAYNSKPAVP